MYSYQVLNTHPDSTANAILVVNQPSLNVPEFKTSSCYGFAQIHQQVVCLGLHPGFTSSSKDADGAMRPQGLSTIFLHQLASLSTEDSSGSRELEI